MLRARTLALTALVVIGFGLPLTGWVTQARAELAATEQVPSPDGEVVAEPAAPRNLRTDAAFTPRQTTPLDRAQSAFGIVALLGLCWVFSRDRKAIDWRLVGLGVGMQATFAVALLWTDLGRGVFRVANDAIVKLLAYGQQGADFLFASHVTGHVEGALKNFAFSVLPSIVFFSALMAVLYHLGVMGAVIRAMSWAMQKTMRTSGAETLSTAANIFVGQTEAPLLVRPFVSRLTKSELLVVMAGGMANTAGGVLAAYVGMLYSFFPDIAGHLLAQSIMSAPAALVTAKMLWPEDGIPVTKGTQRIEIAKVDANAIEAVSRGATEGLSLAFNVAAMLIAFIALVSLLDSSLAWATSAVGLPEITFEAVAGWLFTPFAWLLGVPAQDCLEVGRLLGQKIVLNEFVAYGSLAKGLSEGTLQLTERSMLISSYALSGFANFGSIGILVGGLGALAPERRGDVAALGLLAMVAGSFATFMTACFAGILG